MVRPVCQNIIVMVVRYYYIQNWQYNSVLQPTAGSMSEGEWHKCLLVFNAIFSV